MEKIHDHVDDLYVRALKAYAKSDGVAYAEAAYTTKLTADELHNAFIKGMLLIVDSTGVEYKPISCKVASNVATVTYVTTYSSVATTAKLATVKSA